MAGSSYNPNATFFNGNFGRIPSAADPRLIDELAQYFVRHLDFCRILTLKIARFGHGLGQHRKFEPDFHRVNV